jgi:hypothetical protein
VSVLVEHNICDKYHPSCCITARLNFQESGFRDETEPGIRESLEQGLGSDGRVGYEERIPVSEIKLY